MGIASISWKLSRLALLTLVAAIATFGTTEPAAATTALIAPSPPVAYLVKGAYYDTGVLTLEAMEASLYDTEVLISDQSLLRAGWIVKVGAEFILIEGLAEGGYGNPDTMTIRRARNGTPATTHPANSALFFQTASLDIQAQNVSDSYGLGGFAVRVTLPPEVELLKLAAKTTWLGSTGRGPDCFGLSDLGNNTWEVSCATWPDPGPNDPSWYPPGPNGTGVIARLTVLPPQSGNYTISLAGSRLVNVAGTELDVVPQPAAVKVVDCPDVNMDGWVTLNDSLQTQKAWGDRGRDCGITLASAADASQTTFYINDESLAWFAGSSCALPGTNRPSHIAIDNEAVAAGTFTEQGSPDTVTVTRAQSGTPARAHAAGSKVYITPVQWDGNYDGMNAYTGRRDVDKSGAVTLADSMITVYVWGMQCPQ